MSAMTLIETKTLGTAAASIEFTSIPQDGTDLVALVSIRESRTDAGSQSGISFTLAFNGVTTNQSQRSLFYNQSGGGQGVFTGVDSSFFLWSTSAVDTANTFNNGQIYIPNYAGATNKSFSYEVLGENNGLSGGRMGAALWSSTAAITQITATASSGNFVIGSTISLYKITKGSDGIVTTS